MIKQLISVYLFVLLETQAKISDLDFQYVCQKYNILIFFPYTNIFYYN